ncbi:hypothetical protein SAMN03159512_05369 [Pseudomonas sp. NFR09]|uniref:hypothetical protein n=1 Tax=Pseudomonas sp. NFR09 TaxID=1566249 RepID=UPI0008C2DB31|nr:hypothetical protein [Pseudomonas sp. NFR09]SEU14371.1 hypothetical protein SAMN03159512_05369 [Pseudomonas sp. NFR09]
MNSLPNRSNFLGRRGPYVADWNIYSSMFCIHSKASIQMLEGRVRSLLSWAPTLLQTYTVDEVGVPRVSRRYSVTEVLFVGRPSGMPTIADLGLVSPKSSDQCTSTPTCFYLAKLQPDLAFFCYRISHLLADAVSMRIVSDYLSADWCPTVSSNDDLLASYVNAKIASINNSLTDFRISEWDGFENMYLNGAGDFLGYESQSRSIRRAACLPAVESAAATVVRIGMAIGQITRSGTAYLALNCHGREWIKKGLDTTTIIGWLNEHRPLFFDRRTLCESDESAVHTVNRTVNNGAALSSIWVDSSPLEFPLFGLNLIKVGTSPYNSRWPVVEIAPRTSLDSPGAKRVVAFGIGCLVDGKRVSLSVDYCSINASSRKIASDLIVALCKQFVPC